LFVLPHLIKDGYDLHGNNFGTSPWRKVKIVEAVLVSTFGGEITCRVSFQIKISRPFALIMGVWRIALAVAGLKSVIIKFVFQSFWLGIQRSFT
jgi:hypothetical protein